MTTSFRIAIISKQIDYFPNGATKKTIFNSGKEQKDMNRAVTAQEVGNRLRELRGARRQADVAQAVGVTTMAISQYESGQRMPQDKIKVALANYYGAPVETIFYT